MAAARRNEQQRDCDDRGARKCRSRTGEVQWQGNALLMPLASPDTHRSRSITKHALHQTHKLARTSALVHVPRPWGAMAALLQLTSVLRELALDPEARSSAAASVLQRLLSWLGFLQVC